MKERPYVYKQLQSTQYLFISEGRKRIAKVVEFAELGDNVVNLCFGDLLPDGSIDDTANSNNGDIVKVLATVMDILRAFCSQHPAMLIYFEGSTELRTMLYARILKTYYTDIAEEFAIDGIIEDGEGTQVITYDPQINQKYFGFFVKRKT
jgi:hypothetical protein